MRAVRGPAAFRGGEVGHHTALGYRPEAARFRPQNTVARVLNLVGADQLIPVYASVQEAQAGTQLCSARRPDQWPG